jgi:hypothetical protein
MLGSRFAVSTELIEYFPDIVRHLNHCFQLVLDDSVNDIKQNNHLNIYHKWNKN